MPLTPGSRLGPYEIVVPLGAGGMGEVYRARDAILNRDVAIKVLLPSVVDDPDRLARFRREAQVLASLNHPNIAHIHGLEDFPIVGGVRVRTLVMELVEGDDLSVLIARGPMPLDDALPIAKQIADALEAAHEQGIIHRDLKPANIKVRPDGTVKVLDFGLAKAMDPAATSSANAMNSPTLSIHATQAGIILGTAAYMSPEQARGKAVDRRADIWAFGAVLFEMLAGTRAFAGDDVTDTIVSVVSKEPDWTALPANVSAEVRRLLARCLKKDPKSRMRDIGEARLVIDEGAAGASSAGVVSSLGNAATDPIPVSRRRRLVVAVAGMGVLLGAALTALGAWGLVRTPPVHVQPARWTVTPPGDLTLPTGSVHRDFSLSPDGTHLVYQTGGGFAFGDMYVRAVDQLESVAIRGAFGARGPFISPDSRWVGFSSQAADSGGTFLKKVPMAGGPAITLCRLEGRLQGASWGADDSIVFATDERTTGLMRVRAGGGDPTVLTRPDRQQDHVLPFILPGGKAVLYMISPPVGAVGAGGAQVAVLDLETGHRKTLIPGASHPEYVETGSGQEGYLLYVSSGVLRAVRFDPVRLVIRGDPVPLVEQVLTKSNGTAEYSVSRTGTLVYVTGEVGIQGIANPRTLWWVDRRGREEAITAPPRAYLFPRLSPDGRKVALDVRDQNSDIWTWDLAHPTLTRLTFDPATDMFAIWAPDGKRVMFRSLRSGSDAIYSQSADGTGAVQLLMKGANALIPSSIAADGTKFVAREVTSSGTDVTLVHLNGTARTEALVHTPFNEDNGEISPDGNWLAYQSNEQGKDQIFVRPFPNVEGGRWLVSAGEGRQPAWARNGRELFYMDPGSRALMAVAVQTRPTFSAGTPAKVFATQSYFFAPARSYDVSPDGSKFLMIKDTPLAGERRASASMTVVLNWFEELKTRMAPK